MQRILVATDGSETAARAVAWAGEMAARYESELLVLRVVVDGTVEDGAEEALRRLGEAAGASRARGKVVAADDPSAAIVEAAEAEDADVVVVGNVGMSGRKEFLLGNVPNRVSHNARCTVVIVNTQREERRGLGRLLGRSR